LREVERLLTSFFAEKADQIAIAYLFGSLARRKEAPLSDIDIALLFRGDQEAERRYELAFQLKRLLGVEDIDLVVLNRSPVELKYHVIREGRLVFSDTVGTKVEFEAQVLNQYGDYLPVLERQRQEILEASHGAARVQRYREAFGQTKRVLKQIRAVQNQGEG